MDIKESTHCTVATNAMPCVSTISCWLRDPSLDIAYYHLAFQLFCNRRLEKESNPLRDEKQVALWVVCRGQAVLLQTNLPVVEVCYLGDSVQRPSSIFILQDNISRKNKTGDSVSPLPDAQASSVLASFGKASCQTWLQLDLVESGSDDPLFALQLWRLHLTYSLSLVLQLYQSPNNKAQCREKKCVIVSHEWIAVAFFSL